MAANDNPGKADFSDVEGASTASRRENELLRCAAREREAVRGIHPEHEVRANRTGETAEETRERSPADAHRRLLDREPD